MKTYLITETVRVSYKVKAKNLDEALDKYQEAYDETFNGYHSRLESEDSSDIAYYVADKNQEFKPITDLEEPIK